MSDTIAQRLPRLLVAIEDIANGIDTSADEYYEMHKLRMAAESALENGMRTAAEIIEVARIMRRDRKTK